MSVPVTGAPRGTARRAASCELLDQDLIERFVRLDATSVENRLVVRHLLSGCPACAALISAACRPAVPLDAYDDLLRNCLRPRARVLPFPQ